MDSRILEEQIQKAVAKGHRHLKIKAFGQAWNWGRLWKADDDKVHIRIIGHPGQRVGSLGFPNTFIEIMGPASDAEAIGAKFRWPCFTKEITKKGVKLMNREVIPADTVIISIGDAPDLSFLPEKVDSSKSNN